MSEKLWSSWREVTFQAAPRSALTMRPISPTGQSWISSRSFCDGPVVDLVEKLLPLFGELCILGGADVIAEDADGARDGAVDFREILVQISAEEFVDQGVELDPTIGAFVHRHSGYEVRTK